MDNNLRYGNCLLCGIYIWLHKGGRLKLLKSGHILVRTKNKETWHFKRYISLLPKNMDMLMFKGRIEKLPDR